MTEPRDYHPFLKAKPGARLGPMFALLPAPLPGAVLWTSAGRLVASALLPVGLWIFGWLQAMDVVLLYLAEGASYGLMVVARILFTADSGDSSERPIVAATYCFWYNALWTGLALLTLACVAPKAQGQPFGAWTGAFLARFADRAVWAPAALTAAALAQDAARRGDYIDAYLTAGPREVAKYGYTYPMALTFLMVTAGGLCIVFRGADMNRGDPLIPPVLFAAWLAGWSLVAQLSELTLPMWGRAMGRGGDAFADSLRRE